MGNVMLSLQILCFKKLYETSKPSKIIAAYNKCEVQEFQIIYLFSLPEKVCNKNACKNAICCDVYCEAVTLTLLLRCFSVFHRKAFKICILNKSAFLQTAQKGLDLKILLTEKMLCIVKA